MNDELIPWELDKLIKYTVNQEGCWITNRKPDEDNIVKVSRHKKRTSLARYVYLMVHGEISEGKIIVRQCGNPQCMNPQHLSEGTYDDSLRIRKANGRTARGEQNGRSKLKESDVRYIMQSKEGSCVLAQRFGVDSKVVRDIRSGNKWQSLIESEPEDPWASINAFYDYLGPLVPKR